VAKYVKSNAIVYAKEPPDHRGRRRPDEPRQLRPHRRHQGRTCRVCQVQGAVMASDAFFPFRDGIDNAAKVGITA
jgi:phosphoribosylaminoimidazolecarboxamide formyltransferase/IMP cyclohydrolase